MGLIIITMKRGNNIIIHQPTRAGDSQDRVQLPRNEDENEDEDEDFRHSNPGEGGSSCHVPPQGPSLKV